MRRFVAFIAFFGIIAIAAVAVRTTAQEAAPGGPGDGGPGGPPHRNGSRGHGGPGGGFHLLPPFVVERMKLTDDQKKQVAELEKETKAKLDKILTPEQQKTLETARPPRPRQGGQVAAGADRAVAQAAVLVDRAVASGPGGGPGGDPDSDPGQGGPGDTAPGGDQPSRPQRPASE